MAVEIKIVYAGRQVSNRQRDVAKVLRIAAALIHEIRMSKIGGPSAVLHRETDGGGCAVRKEQIAQGGELLKRGRRVIPEIARRLTRGRKTGFYPVVGGEINVQKSYRRRWTNIEYCVSAVRDADAIRHLNRIVPRVRELNVGESQQTGRGSIDVGSIEAPLIIQ